MPRPATIQTSPGVECPSQVPATIRTLEHVILVEGWGPLDKQELHALTGEIDAFLARQERFLVVADLLRADGISAGGRQVVTQHRSRLRGKAETFDLGLVLAVRSPIVRGALTAIAWVSGELEGLRVVESRPELARVGRELLVHHGIAVGVEHRRAFEALAGTRSDVA